MKLNKLIYKILVITFCCPLISMAYSSEKQSPLDYNDTGSSFSIYSGVLDFSDRRQKAPLIGFEHQNNNLNKDTFIGNISPITGALLTSDMQGYIYTGIQAKYKLGKVDFTPSFTPGLYGRGHGKDLGHIIEFKTELQFSLNLAENSKMGFRYNHISNAQIGDKNPGINSYMFNFLKKF